MKNELISVIKTVAEYPQKEQNYRPNTPYPEYLFDDFSEEKNYVYEAVRESFHLLHLDEKNYGRSTWNPLGEFVSPGNMVVIKPNMVMDVNRKDGQDTDCLFTHPSVVAAVIDYLLIALKGSGKIVLGDAPMQECVFDRIINEGGYGQLVDFYKNKDIDIELVDFRELTSTVKNGVHVTAINEKAKGTVIDLKEQSEFYGMPQNRMKDVRITNYDPRILPTHHNGITNEYYISDYILQADVIINMPKPKSHRKAGATIALKNFVGTNVRKEFLPHHTMGSKAEGGDEYLKKNIIHKLKSELLDKKNVCEAEKHYNVARMYWLWIKCCDVLMRIIGAKEYEEGSWYGNNTISKTVSDINKIVKFADKNGKMCDEPQRKMLIVADMIIAGEKEGPVFPTAKPVGIIASGENPVSFDRAIAALMGFSPERIPTLQIAEGIKGKYQLVSKNQFLYASNDKKYDGMTDKDISYDISLKFEATSGWKGHIESN